MSDLSRRVAEAQGWTATVHNIEWHWWKDAEPIMPIADYHPDTDIAQAMAFAEWVGAKISIDNCDDIWTCTVYNDDMKARGWSQAESFAECLCKAVLAALEK